MKFETNQPSCRRQFLRLTAYGVLSAGVLPLLPGCTKEEVEKFFDALYHDMNDLAILINDYRKQNGLTAIPVSPRLSNVAATHFVDITLNHPEANCKGNLHSWSIQTYWKGGCFDLADSSTWPVMWEKPKEIAGYPNYGYEIAAIGYPTPAQTLAGWKGSPPHNDVILNKGIWTGYQWKALGAFFSQGFSCAWFGVDAA
jgi:hypothetical protein